MKGAPLTLCFCLLETIGLYIKTYLKGKIKIVLVKFSIVVRPNCLGKFGNFQENLSGRCDRFMDPSVDSSRGKTPG